MPPRDWTLRIQDIIDAIGAIQRYTEGMDLDALLADPMAVDAVAWNFIVIGEAAGHVPPEILGQYPSIPWSRMRALRNVAVHEYFRLSLPRLWTTIRQELPPLVPLLGEILGNEP
ncbi:MAG TPA: DUF86 domain-containing protein [Chloroflexota bacterium]